MNSTPFSAVSRFPPRFPPPCARRKPPWPIHVQWQTVLLVGVPRDGSARLDASGPRSTADTPLAPAFPRVRSEDAVLSGLIQQATDRSPTFRRLLAAIPKTDGLVYVQRGRRVHAEQDATIESRCGAPA